jgi:hypothetical protein
MDASFAAFDPVVWLIFGAFVVSTYLIVRIFHVKHPDYPGKLE